MLYSMSYIYLFFRFFFFFQAEDGIRDVAVTGVQTCALPISVAPLPLRLAFSASIRSMICVLGASVGSSVISLPSTDRKSTRLNSSHGYISYAVFSLKKKTAVQPPPALTAPRHTTDRVRVAGA